MKPSDDITCHTNDGILDVSNLILQHLREGVHNYTPVMQTSANFYLNITNFKPLFKNHGCYE
jgi:hypothetical protein